MARAKYEPERALAAGGRQLWDAVIKGHDLDAAQKANLLEACRLKDRLDELDSIIQGKGVLELLRFRRMDEGREGTADDPLVIEVKFDDVITRANATANQMKQQLAALRLPDAAGNRPQQRGGARGAYAPGGSALDNVRSIVGGKAG